MLCCREKEEKIQQLRIGNLALPATLQQAPLFSFGQHIIGKNQLYGWEFIDYVHGDNDQKLSLLSTNLLYGITDKVSLDITIPFVVVLQSDDIKVTGLSDIFLNVEWAYYFHYWQTATVQATLLGGLTFPMGVPPLAAGSPIFFLGATLSYLSIDWYAFTSFGAELPTTFCCGKSGNEFLYQFGVGHNITNRQGLVIACLLELDGVFAQQDTFKGICDPNSGGNSISIGPSLWVASERFIIQPGIQAIIDRHLNGNQDKNRFAVSLDIGYLFH